MKKIYKNPMLKAINIDSEALCLQTTSDPANMDPAGAKFRKNKFKATASYGNDAEYEEEICEDNVSEDNDF